MNSKCTLVQTPTKAQATTSLTASSSLYISIQVNLSDILRLDAGDADTAADRFFLNDILILEMYQLHIINITILDRLQVHISDILVLDQCSQKVA